MCFVISVANHNCVLIIINRPSTWNTEREALASWTEKLFITEKQLTYNRVRSHSLMLHRN